VTVCPVQCISLETEEGVFPEDKWVSVFDINFGVCVFCGVCVDHCAPQSLTHRPDFEVATVRASDLIHRFGLGRISTEQKRKWQDIRNQKKEESGRLF
jgi:formate hydrogenlyase subunit 6/NADH:ubiquinone oxidoreductase subunit I